MKNIAVIGGGVAGLTLALELACLPTNHVTIFEKSNRIGGRINSFNVSDK